MVIRTLAYDPYVHAAASQATRDRTYLPDTACLGVSCRRCTAVRPQRVHECGNGRGEQKCCKAEAYVD